MFSLAIYVVDIETQILRICLLAIATMELLEFSCLTLHCTCKKYHQSSLGLKADACKLAMHGHMLNK